MLIQFRTRHSSLLREAHVQCTPFRIMTYFDDVIDTTNIQKLFSVSGILLLTSKYMAPQKRNFVNCHVTTFLLKSRFLIQS